MDNQFVLLTEKEAMWAKMLLEVLEDNHIPCTSLPVHGAGLVLKAGVSEQLRVFVHRQYLHQAQDLLEILFSEESIVE